MLVTNSPYMGSSNINDWLSGWVEESRLGLSFFRTGAAAGIVLPTEYEATLFGTSDNVASIMVHDALKGVNHNDMGGC